MKSLTISKQDARVGLQMLGGMVALMWLVELINTIDSNHLDADGIYARNIGRIWGILTSPFIHASWSHLIDNTIPLLCIGAFVAIRGAARFVSVTGLIIVLGGLGTWLISPSNGITIGASGVVFGYATYVLVQGYFNRSMVELLWGVIVGVLWGLALVSSLVPHQGVSWQAHLCGGLAGVLAAWLMRQDRAATRATPVATP